jgi:hypothetical protein
MDEHDDDVEPEVNEGAEVEVEEFSVTEEEEDEAQERETPKGAPDHDVSDGSSITPSTDSDPSEI